MPAPAPRQPRPAEAVRSPSRRRNQTLATLAFTSGLVALSTGLGSAALAEEATGPAPAPAGQAAAADSGASAATTGDASAATTPAGAADAAASESPTPATGDGAAPTTQAPNQNASDPKPAEQQQPAAPTGGTPQTSPPATASTSTSETSTTAKTSSSSKTSSSAKPATNAKASSTKTSATSDSKSSSSKKCPSGDSAVRHIEFSINGGSWRSPSNGHIPGLSAGDRVAARFEIHKGCSDYKVGLASYESNTSKFGKNTRQTLYRSDVGKFSPGKKHQLGPIKNAPCQFQVDLFRGDVLSHITPDHRYGRDRLLAWDIGGAPCKEKERQEGGGGQKPEAKPKPAAQPKPQAGGAKAPKVKAAKAKRHRVRAERTELPRTGTATGAMALTGFAATLVGGSLVVSAYWRRREQEDAF